jgi:hypothetical protein
MTENNANGLPALAEDEKITMVMVYLDQGIVWGNVITKSQIRVSTWLRTTAAPDFMTIYQANFLLTYGGVAQKPVVYPVIHIPTPKILAIHIMPPNSDPLDYDPTEPNRKLEKAGMILGGFIFEGFIRIASISNLNSYIDVTREEFSTLYDLTITCRPIPSLGTMKVPYALIRQSAVMWCNRDN